MDDKRNIDESWKETVEKEKESLRKDSKFIPQEPDFKFFITTLSLQASIALGYMPNPATNKNEEDLTQAKFLIDTLIMLKEKTNGNLNPEETNVLENLLYELRMGYISKSKGEKMIDKELLDILACPACKGDVELKDDRIVCKNCGKKYPIKDGIPIMLIDEAEG